MIRLTNLRGRVGGGAALAGVALLVAACGSSTSSSPASTSTSTTTGAGSASAPAATGSEAAARTVSIATAAGPHGTFLAGAGGRALYLWDGDHGARSSCSGACAQAWPPLLAKSAPHARGAVRASDLGTITRAGATRQVTYKGHPLYYFAGDTGAGTTAGQGSSEFGAKWWLVGPAGSAITASAGGGQSSSTAGSSAGGY